MNYNIYKDDNMEKEIVKSVVEMSAYVFERGLVSGKAGNVSARFKGEKGDIVAITPTLKSLADLREEDTYPFTICNRICIFCQENKAS